MNRTQKDIAAYYKTIEIQTASPGKIIEMLHTRCFEHMLKAVSLRLPEEKKSVCIKAQNILVQLQISLQQSDAVSNALYYIYDYIYVLLDKAVSQEILQAIRIFSLIRTAVREKFGN
ncbi:MAG: flagellar protein FliS [Chitinivibrionales bacterium]|nr:flagellar protein FliS [Chitinivibrionales bacterium]